MVNCSDPNGLTFRFMRSNRMIHMGATPQVVPIRSCHTTCESINLGNFERNRVSNVIVFQIDHGEQKVPFLRSKYCY